MAKQRLGKRGLKCHPKMSSIYSFAASVNAYDHLNDVFWGDVINHRVKRPHGMWIHVEIFFWRENRIANELQYCILCSFFFLIVRLNTELQQLLGCDQKTGLLNPAQPAHGTWRSGVPDLQRGRQHGDALVGNLQSRCLGTRELEKELG